MSCTNCQAATTDHLALCVACQTTTSHALVNVSAYHADVARIQPGERVKVRGAYQSTPPPATKDAYDRISAVLDAVENSIGTWCRALADDRHEAGKIPGSLMARTAWLEKHLPSIATLEWAGEMMRDVMACERKLLTILDKSDTGWYAGECGAVIGDERVHDGTTCGCACHNGADYPCDVPGGCGTEVVSLNVTCPRNLYVTPGQSYVRCPECGTTYKSADRRDKLMADAREKVAPVTVIARAVVGLVDSESSVERLANRIDQWVKRERLADLGVRVLTPGAKPQRVYRLGDVFDLLKIDTAKVETEDGKAC